MIKCKFSVRKVSVVRLNVHISVYKTSKSSIYDRAAVLDSHSLTQCPCRVQKNVTAHKKYICHVRSETVRQKDRQLRRIGKPRGREKADVDKKGSGRKRAMISRRCRSSASVTPADVTPFKAACHPPRGCCGRQIAQQTACPTPGWDWFAGYTYCTVRAADRTGACVSALDSARRLLQTRLLLLLQKMYNSYTGHLRGNRARLRYYFSLPLRKSKEVKSAMEPCTRLGLWPDVAIVFLHYSSEGIQVFLSSKFSMPSACQRARSSLFTSGRGERSASLFQPPRQVTKAAPSVLL